MLFVLGDGGLDGDEVELEIALPAQRIGIVVDRRRGGLVAAFLGEDRPDELVVGFVVGGLLDPADDIERRDSALLAFLVVGFGAVLDRLQQLIGVPGLGLFILDMAAIGVVDGH